MNAILKNLRVEKKHRTMRDDFFIMDINIAETGNEKPYTLDSNVEYELTAKFGARFWANSVQLRDAEKRARKALSAALFGDLRAVALRGVAETHNGDREAVLNVFSEILEMTEESDDC